MFCHAITLHARPTQSRHDTAVQGSEVECNEMDKTWRSDRDPKAYLD